MDIKLNAVGTPINELIKQKLKDADLPECFGNMCPPIIDDILHVPNEVAKHKNSVAEEDVVLKNLAKIVGIDTSPLLIADLVLDKEGVQFIQHKKELLATMFVEQLIRCVDCQHTKLCDKLTKNYLMNLYLK